MLGEEHVLLGPVPAWAGWRPWQQRILSFRNLNVPLSDIPDMASLTFHRSTLPFRRALVLLAVLSATAHGQGRLPEQLAARLATAHAADTFRVHIALRTPAVKHLNRYTHTEDELREHARAVSRLQSFEPPAVFARRYGLRTELTDPSSVLTTVTKATLSALARDHSVAWVEELLPRRPCAMVEPFSKLPAGALNPAEHWADRQGEGVRAGIVEGYLTNEYRLCRAGRWPEPVDTPTHTDQTYGCLLNTAPAATVDYRSGVSYIESSVRAWLVDSAVETVSMSLKPPYPTPPDNIECLLMDDLAYQYPFPVVVTPAGNDGAGERTAFQAYNCLHTGSVRFWQESSYVFDQFTQARNPAPVYGACVDSSADSCCSDRELPDLLAPGSHPYDPPDNLDWWRFLWSDPCVRGYWPGKGTSYSAPIANGIAARLISAAPKLFRGRPEAVKMALMLTAQDVDREYWNPSVDGNDGAGAISAYAAVEYAFSCTDLSGQAVALAVEHGYVADTGAEGMSERPFAVLIPSSPPPHTHLRVTLVWTSNPDPASGANHLSDLDIGAFTSDSASYASASLDANVEMFDVPAGELTAGATYSFTLFPRTIRIPPTASADFFYYALGWTWVADTAGGLIAGAGPQQASPPGRSHGMGAWFVDGVLRLRLPPGLSAAPRLAVHDLCGRAVIDWQAVGGAGHARSVGLPVAAGDGVYLVSVRCGTRQWQTTARLVR